MYILEKDYQEVSKFKFIDYEIKLSKFFNMKMILFVCTGNTCRSPMAEIYFNDKIKKMKNSNYYAESAGTFARGGGRISPGAYEVLKKNQIEIPQSFASKPLTKELIQKSDTIYFMEQAHKDFAIDNFSQFKDKYYLLSEINQEEKDIDDPIGCETIFFEHIFHDIKRYIDLFMNKIKTNKV